MFYFLHRVVFFNAFVKCFDGWDWYVAPRQTGCTGHCAECCVSGSQEILRKALYEIAFGSTWFTVSLFLFISLLWFFSTISSLYKISFPSRSSVSSTHTFTNTQHYPSFSASSPAPCRALHVNLLFSLATLSPGQTHISWPSLFLPLCLSFCLTVLSTYTHRNTIISTLSTLVLTVLHKDTHPHVICSAHTGAYRCMRVICSKWCPHINTVHSSIECLIHLSYMYHPSIPLAQSSIPPCNCVITTESDTRRQAVALWTMLLQIM